MNRILFFLVLFSKIGFAQAPMDGPFVSERFQVYNGLVNFKVWSIGDFLVMNAPQFELEMADVTMIQNQNIQQFEANYLFQEESHWVKRLFRTLIFDNHAINSGLNTLKTEQGSVSLGKFLQKNLENEKLFLFRNSEFNVTVFGSDINASQLNDVVGVRFKQDFAYNRISNKLEVYISGFAPLIKDESGAYKELFWLNYGNFKGEVGAQGAKCVLLDNLKSGKLKATVDRVENSIMRGVVDRSYQSDLDALVELKLLEEKLALTPQVYRKEGSFKVEVDDEIIKGEILHGLLSGTIIIKHKERGEILEVEYVNGTPSGKYVSYHSKGKIKEEGVFDAGLRESTWSTYFQNGKLSSRKEYITGFLEGAQAIYFENGNLRDRYQFSNGVLSNDFASFYSDGGLKCQGNVKNGLVSGKWEYVIRLSKKQVELINRNPQFWDSKFKIVKGWDSNALKAPELKFNVKYEHSVGKNCLNQLCPKMTVLPASN